MSTIVGIDIDHSTLRATVLRAGLRKMQVERFIEIPISRMGQAGAQAPATTAALRELWQTLGAAPDLVIAAVEAQRASIRSLNVPAAAAKRVAAVLPFELDQVVPFEISEAITDYQEIGTHDGQLAVLTAAVPQSTVREVLETFRSAGVEPRDLAVGAACLDTLASLLPVGDADAAVLVLNVREIDSELCVLRHGRAELARAIAEGMTTLNARPDAMRRALAQTLAKYRAEGGPALSKCIVIGEAGENPALIEWFASVLGLEAESLVMPVSETGAGSPAFARSYALAARGLDRVRRINLRRGLFASADEANAFRTYALLAVAACLAVFGAYLFNVWAEYEVLVDERDGLAARLEATSESELGIRTSSARQAAQLLESGGSRSDPLPRFDAFAALAAISGAVPADIGHEAKKLEIQLDETGKEGTFSMSGLVKDLAERDRIAAALEAHECVTELERGKTSALPGQDKKAYTLEGTLKCPAIGKKPSAPADDSAASSKGGKKPKSKAKSGATGGNKDKTKPKPATRGGT